MKKQKVSDRIDAAITDILNGKGVKAIREELKNEKYNTMTADKIVSKAVKQVELGVADQARRIMENGGSQDHLSAFYKDLDAELSQKFIERDVKQYKSRARKVVMKTLEVTKAKEEFFPNIIEDFSDQIVKESDIQNWIVDFLNEFNEEHNNNVKKYLIMGPVLAILVALIVMLDIHFSWLTTGAFTFGLCLLGYGIYGLKNGKRELPSFA